MEKSLHLTTISQVGIQLKLFTSNSSLIILAVGWSMFCLSGEMLCLIVDMNEAKYNQYIVHNAFYHNQEYNN